MTKPVETANEISLDQAFKDAVNAAAEKTEPSEKTVEESESETETDEQSAQESDEVPDASEESTEQTEQLISDEEFEKLRQDPVKLRKELNRAFTQKTQSLAKDRKDHEAQVEKYEQYKNFIEAFEQDQAGTIVQLAEQYGIEIAPEAGKPAEQDTKKTTAKTGEKGVSASFQVLKDALGPDFESFAERLAPAVDALVTARMEELGKKVEARIKPIEAQELANETKKEISAFGKDFPDWKKHEKEMVALGKKFYPAEGTTTVEYLEFLYKLATGSKKDVKKTVELVKKINKVPSNSENPNTGAPRGKIIETPVSPDLRESFEMALKGELVQE